MLLTIENLTVSFATENGRQAAVEAVDLAIGTGEILGLVGESGCGKSVTALSMMRLLPQPSGRIEGGRILFEDLDLVRLPAGQMQTIRGRRLAMIFQEPMTALNPVHNLGRQLGEVLRLHQRDLDFRARQKEAIRLLEQVGIPDPRRRLREYPHQISGGMRQRVMIAMALAGGPDLLIADEPTTALDVTIQAQILDLIQSIQQARQMAVLLITHDLGVIAQICQRVAVMYAGKIVETAPVEALFANPAHPYTQGLLASIPRLETRPQTRLPVIPGMVPTLSERPAGCRFQNRCAQTRPLCREREPALRPVGASHWAGCHLIPEKDEP